jgi:hypothetical protein
VLRITKRKCKRPNAPGTSKRKHFERAKKKKGDFSWSHQDSQKWNLRAMKQGALRLDVRYKRVPTEIFRNLARNPRRNLRSQKSLCSALVRGKIRRNGNTRRSWKNKKGGTRKYDGRRRLSSGRRKRKLTRDEGEGSSKKRKRHESKQRGSWRMTAGRRVPVSSEVSLRIAVT